jgi:hypothetical protein
LGVQLVVIQEKVDGLGNFHAPPPVFDGIMLMLIDREYHNFLRKSDKFLSWQVRWNIWKKGRFVKIMGCVWYTTPT